MGMRRVHVPELRAGEVSLENEQAHHARNVLRLGVGDEVEAFDDAGKTGRAVIARCDDVAVVLRLTEMRAAPTAGIRWIIASAVPKAARADWMVEKLSELGAEAFVPLAAARSVVLPEGKGKRERWERLAREAAKQSRRAGVMRVEELTGVKELLAGVAGAEVWYFSTGPAARAVTEVMAGWERKPEKVVMLVGPEGGWTDEEEAMFDQSGLKKVSLGNTVLRVETAAVAAGAIMAAVVAIEGVAKA